MSQSDSSGAAKPAGRAELQPGPGDLWGGSCFGNSAFESQASLLSVISGHLHLGECNELLFPASQGAVLCPSPRCREAAREELEGPWCKWCRCDGSCVPPSTSSVVTAGYSRLGKLCFVKIDLNSSVVVGLFSLELR